MTSTAEATHLPQGSLDRFLAGPVIRGDGELSSLVIQAESLRHTPLLIYSYPQQRTLHLAEGILPLTGYSPREICEGGISFLLKITNPEDIGYLTLLQSGFIQEAKIPGFNPCSIRFHDYYWSVVRRNGTRVPVATTNVVLTYSPQMDFGISVGFYVRNDRDCEANLTRCKDILRRIKKRHSEVHLHSSAQEPLGPYPIHYANTTADIITQRERQVLGMLAQGHSTDAIAVALSIAANTVESHRKKLLQKFEAKNSAELIKKASKIFWLS